VWTRAKALPDWQKQVSEHLHIVESEIIRLNIIIAVREHKPKPISEWGLVAKKRSIKIEPAVPYGLFEKKKQEKKRYQGPISGETIDEDAYAKAWLEHSKMKEMIHGKGPKPKMTKEMKRGWAYASEVSREKPAQYNLQGFVLKNRGCCPGGCKDCANCGVCCYGKSPHCKMCRQDFELQREEKAHSGVKTTVKCKCWINNTFCKKHQHFSRVTSSGCANCLGCKNHHVVARNSTKADIHTHPGPSAGCSEPVPYDHEDARDSTKADIHPHPGPSFLNLMKYISGGSHIDLVRGRLESYGEEPEPGYCYARHHAFPDLGFCPTLSHLAMFIDDDFPHLGFQLKLIEKDYFHAEDGYMLAEDFKKLSAKYGNAVLGAPRENKIVNRIVRKSGHVADAMADAQVAVTLGLNASVEVATRSIPAYWEHLTRDPLVWVPSPMDPGLQPPTDFYPPGAPIPTPDLPPIPVEPGLPFLDAPVQAPQWIIEIWHGLAQSGHVLAHLLHDLHLAVLPITFVVPICRFVNWLFYNEEIPETFKGIFRKYETIVNFRQPTSVYKDYVARASLFSYDAPSKAQPCGLPYHAATLMGRNNEIAAMQGSAPGLYAHYSGKINAMARDLDGRQVYKLPENATKGFEVLVSSLFPEYTIQRYSFYRPHAECGTARQLLFNLVLSQLSLLGNPAVTMIGASAQQVGLTTNVVHNHAPRLTGRDNFRYENAYSKVLNDRCSEVSCKHRFQDCGIVFPDTIVVAPLSLHDTPVKDLVASMIENRQELAYVIGHLPLPFLDERLKLYVDDELGVRFERNGNQISMTHMCDATAGYYNSSASMMSWCLPVPVFPGFCVVIEEERHIGSMYLLKVKVKKGKQEAYPVLHKLSKGQFYILPLLKPDWRMQDDEDRHFVVPSVRFDNVVKFATTNLSSKAVYEIVGNKVRGQESEIKVGNQVLLPRWTLSNDEFNSIVTHAIVRADMLRRDHELSLARGLRYNNVWYNKMDGSFPVRYAIYVAEMITFAPLRKRRGMFERITTERITDKLFASYFSSGRFEDPYSLHGMYRIAHSSGEDVVKENLVRLLNRVGCNKKARDDRDLPYTVRAEHLGDLPENHLDADVFMPDDDFDVLRRDFVTFIPLPGEEDEAEIRDLLGEDQATRVNTPKLSELRRTREVRKMFELPERSELNSSKACDLTESDSESEHVTAASSTSEEARSVIEQKRDTKGKGKAVEEHDVDNRSSQNNWRGGRAFASGFRDVGNKVKLPNTLAPMGQFSSNMVKTKPATKPASVMTAKTITSEASSGISAASTDMAGDLLDVFLEEPTDTWTIADYNVDFGRRFNGKIDFNAPLKDAFVDLPTSSNSHRDFVARFSSPDELTTFFQQYPDASVACPDRGARKLCELILNRQGAPRKVYEMSFDIDAVCTDTSEDAKDESYVASWLEGSDDGEEVSKELVRANSMEKLIRTFWGHVRKCEWKYRRPDLLLDGIPSSAKSTLARMIVADHHTLVVTPTRKLKEEWESKTTPTTTVVTQHTVPKRFSCSHLIIDECNRLDKHVLEGWLTLAYNRKIKNVICIGDKFQTQRFNTGFINFGSGVLRGPTIKFFNSFEMPLDSLAAFLHVNDIQDDQRYSTLSKIDRSIIIIDRKVPAPHEFTKYDLFTKSRLQSHSIKDPNGDEIISVTQAQGTRCKRHYFTPAIETKSNKWLASMRAIPSVLFTRHSGRLVIDMSASSFKQAFPRVAIEREHFINGKSQSKLCAERATRPSDLDFTLTPFELPYDSPLYTSEAVPLQTSAQFGDRLISTNPDPDFYVNKNLEEPVNRVTSVKMAYEVILKRTQHTSRRDFKESLDLITEVAHGLLSIGEIGFGDEPRMKSHIEGVSALGDVQMARDRYHDIRNVIQRQLSEPKDIFITAQHVSDAKVMHERFIKSFCKSEWLTYCQEHMGYDYYKTRTTTFVEAWNDPFGYAAKCFTRPTFLKTQVKVKPGLNGAETHGQTVIANSPELTNYFGPYARLGYFGMQRAVRDDFIVDVGYSDIELNELIKQRGISARIESHGNIQIDLTKQDSTHRPAHVLAYSLFLQMCGVPEELCQLYVVIRSLAYFKSMAQNAYKGLLKWNLGSGDPFTLNANCHMMMSTLAVKYEGLEYCAGLQKGDDFLCSDEGLSDSQCTFSCYERQQVNMKIDPQPGTHDMKPPYHAGRFMIDGELVADPVRAFMRHFAKPHDPSTTTEELWRSYTDRRVHYTERQVQVLRKFVPLFYEEISEEEARYIIEIVVSLRSYKVFASTYKYSAIDDCHIFDPTTDCAYQVAAKLNPSLAPTTLRLFRRKKDPVELCNLYKQYGINSILACHPALVPRGFVGAVVSSTHVYGVTRGRPQYY